MLRVENITAAHGALKVLHDVSMEVNAGEVVALVGANNAGKSTLMRCITGLLKPTSGRIVLDGEDLACLPPHEIVNRGLVMVCEGRGIFPQMTTEENLLLGGYNSRAKKERAANFRKAYDLFPRLRERKDQKAGTLSGGEQQMLAVARALMAKPQILLLDEPSLGLAPMVVRQIFEVFRDLSRQGLTMLLVEQNVELSLTVSSRAYVLSHGRIVFQGASQEVARSEVVRQAYLGISA